MPFNRKDHHNPGEVRPRFALRTDLPYDQIFDHLDAFVRSDNSVDGKIVHNQYYLDIPISERHYWSPELRVSIEEDEYNEYDGDSIIRVTVGPQYSVWVMFIFMYSFLILVSLFGGLFGISQLMLGIQSVWIWCFPISFGLLIGVYVISKTGQNIGRDHTLHLVSTLYHALGDYKHDRIDL